ncbi:hypothetical protein SprV_0200683400 [Sparganum proliferum]
MRQLRDGMMACAMDNWAVPEALAVTKGVEQGSILAPTFLRFTSSAMLVDVHHDEHPGTRIANMTDGQRLKGPTRLSMNTLRDLLLPDGCMLNTIAKPDMQRRTDLFDSGYADFWLTINAHRTMVIRQQSSSIEYNASRIIVNSTQLKIVGNFTYLDSALSHTTKIDDKVAAGSSNSARSLADRRPQSGITIASISTPNSQCTKLSSRQR